MIKQFYFLIIFLVPLVSVAQQTFDGTDCRRIKNGTFYFYPPTNQKGFIVHRNGTIQKEINLSTGDTTFWEVHWKSACVFEVKFIRKSQPMPLEESKFYKSHTTVFGVLNSQKSYYVFKGGLDSINNPRALTDTMWLKPR
jgi:hypothetical protein